LVIFPDRKNPLIFPFLNKNSRRYYIDRYLYIVDFLGGFANLSNEIIRAVVATINWAKKVALTSWLMKLKHTQHHIYASTTQVSALFL